MTDKRLLQAVRPTMNDKTFSATKGIRLTFPLVALRAALAAVQALSVQPAGAECKKPPCIPIPDPPDPDPQPPEPEPDPPWPCPMLGSDPEPPPPDPCPPWSEDLCWPPDAPPTISAV